jgi:hypothetical protein
MKNLCSAPIAPLELQALDLFDMSMPARLPAHAPTVVVMAEDVLLDRDKVVEKEGQLAAQLTERLRGKKQEGKASKTVNLAIVREVPVKRVIEVLGAIRSAGIGSVQLLFAAYAPEDLVKPPDSEAARTIENAAPGARAAAGAMVMNKAITFCPTLDKILADVGNAQPDQRCGLLTESMREAAGSLFCIADIDAYLTGIHGIIGAYGFVTALEVTLNPETQGLEAFENDQWYKVAHQIAESETKPTEFWIKIPSAEDELEDDSHDEQDAQTEAEGEKED